MTPSPSAPVEANTVADRPAPHQIRGRCPVCGDDLVSQMVYVPGKGYYLEWRCWSNRGDNPVCHYRRVL